LWCLNAVVRQQFAEIDYSTFAALLDMRLALLLAHDLN